MSVGKENLREEASTTSAVMLVLVKISTLCSYVNHVLVLFLIPTHLSGTVELPLALFPLTYGRMQSGSRCRPVSFQNSLKKIIK